ncbi:MAG: hypothetical protein HQL30_05700 [Candidatus Omnitrophica bacterium]|nr:hypothetical protein [Candidatus Omnitrophota bacterium]
MSQHPSLKSGAEGKFRSVIKRHERVKELAEKESWLEEKDSVYKLPKVKRILFKAKKTKAAAEEGAQEAGAPAGAPAGAQKAQAAPKAGASPKAGAAAKGASPKAPEGKK